MSAATENDFRTWWIGAKAIDATVDGLDLGEEQIERLQSEKHGLEALIATRRAETRIGILIKARLLNQHLATDGDEFGAGLVREIIAFLEAAR